MSLSETDAYSVDDIVYEWIPGEVGVGHKEMAQFEYKGARLTSDFNVYSMGKQVSCPSLDYSSFLFKLLNPQLISRGLIKSRRVSKSTYKIGQLFVNFPNPIVSFSIHIHQLPPLSIETSPFVHLSLF